MKEPLPTIALYTMALKPTNTYSAIKQGPCTRAPWAMLTLFPMNIEYSFLPHEILLSNKPCKITLSWILVLEPI